MAQSPSSAKKSKGELVSEEEKEQAMMWIGCLAQQRIDMFL